MKYCISRYFHVSVVTMPEVSKWKKFANDIKLNKIWKRKSSAYSSILENKEITLHRGQQATGRLKKYERTGVTLIWVPPCFVYPHTHIISKYVTVDLDVSVLLY